MGDMMKTQDTIKTRKKGFKFGDLKIRFSHPVTVQNENESGEE
jgi:hypothetical protein